MRTRQSLIDDNARLLEQGIALLEGIEDDLYAKAEGAVASSGIGSHFRHVIDFYERFLVGLGEGEVDYDRRDRDAELEVSGERARARLREMVETLEALVEKDLPGAVTVKTDSLVEDVDTTSSGSSVERELQFLISHTVHHYALIAVILRLNDHEVSLEFGVAPSTLRYWRETRACAP